MKIKRKEGVDMGSKEKDNRYNGSATFFLLIILFALIVIILSTNSLAQIPLREEKEFEPFDALSFSVEQNNYISERLSGVLALSLLKYECLPVDLELDVSLMNLEKESLEKNNPEKKLGSFYLSDKINDKFESQVSNLYSASLNLAGGELGECLPLQTNYDSAEKIYFTLNVNLAEAIISGLNYAGLFSSVNLPQEISGILSQILESYGLPVSSNTIPDINGGLFTTPPGFGSETSSFSIELQVSAKEPVYYNTHPFSPSDLTYSITNVRTSDGEILPSNVIEVRREGNIIKIVTDYGLKESDLKKYAEKNTIEFSLDSLDYKFKKEDEGANKVIVKVIHKRQVVKEISKEIFVFSEEIPEKEKEKIEKCIPEWECGEWSPCSLKWNFFGFIQNNIKKYFSPMQYITCYDKNNCESQKISLKRNCISKEVFSVVRKKTSMEIYEGKNKVASVFLSEVPGETIKIDLKGI